MDGGREVGREGDVLVPREKNATGTRPQQCRVCVRGPSTQVASTLAC